MSEMERGESMVERVGAALEQIEFSLPGAGGLRGRLRLAPAKASELARAAIAAMREPTAAMLRVPELQDADDVAYAWRAMIDAALK